MKKKDPIVDYLKSLNPKKEEQAILIYGSDYHLWKDGEYLGVGTWTKDENVGDSFQRTAIDKDEGYAVQQVLIADKWELVIKKLSQFE